jgi:4-amino-4-deoxy-L-arabinose transferase-like glycosyltransferase
MPPPDAASVDANGVPAARGVDRIVLLVLLVAAVSFWSWLAFGVHTLPVVGGESDNYVDRAADALAGRLTADPFHPLGLPLLIAGVAWFGLEPWTAGRLVVIAFGVLLVAAAWLLARRFAGWPLATAAVLAFVASEHVLVGSVQVCTDVPATAMMTVALWAWTRCAGAARAPASWLWLGGLALGLAATLRMPSLALGPAFAPLLLGIATHERLRRIGWAMAGGALGLVPHIAIGWLWPRPPMNNFAQIVWKYRYRWDDPAFLAYLERREPFPWDALPGWLLQGCGDLGGYLAGGLGAPWSLQVASLATAVSVLLALGMLVGLARARRDPAGAVVAAGGLVYTSALCILSLPLARFTVPTLLPPLVLLVAAATAARTRLVRGAATVATLVLMSAALLRAPASLREFDRLHPRADLAAIEALVAEHGEWLTIATPAIGLQHRVKVFTTDVQRPLDAAADAAGHWRHLLGQPAVVAADFVVVGRRTWPQFAARLREAVPADRYRVVRDDEVLVLAPVAVAPWCERASATRRGADLVLEVHLAAAFDRSRAAGVGFRLRSDSGTWHDITLLPAPDGAFRRTLENGTALLGRDSVLWPAMLTRDGALRRGPSVRVAD